MKAQNNITGEIVTNFDISKEFGTISYIDNTGVLRFSTPKSGEWTIIDSDRIETSMKIYIIQNENNEIIFVCYDPIEALEELERIGKETLMLTIWPVSDEKPIAKHPIDDARLKVIQTPAQKNDSIMNHDITHCCNENCKDKTECYRYLAYLKLKDKKIEGTYSLYISKNVTSKEECKVPWIVKD